MTHSLPPSMTEPLPPNAFQDRNFKLAVIHALHELGEFRSLIEGIQRDRQYGQEGPYFRNAEGKAWFGPIPRSSNSC